jgi:hypothetical protein
MRLHEKAMLALALMTAGNYWVYRAKMGGHWAWAFFGMAECAWAFWYFVVETVKESRKP